MVWWVAIGRCVMAIVGCVMAIGECVTVLGLGPNLVVLLAAGSTCGGVSSSGVLRKESCGQKTHFCGPSAAKQSFSFL